ncbi:MAG: WecB/TagA/CpsF family glycosyltransferase [Cyanobacteria bacterium]|nr:WecB/TagA/CpsF family glycosyltransferase [Cyanobacteriota bacterium]
MRSIALRYNFYGGSSRVAAQAATVMQAKYPGLQIAGVENGFITAEQMPEFCDRLSELQPRLIYVGLGVARQEFWIAQHRHLCPNAVWIGMSGSFDSLGGYQSSRPAMALRSQS